MKNDIKLDLGGVQIALPRPSLIARLGRAIPNLLYFKCFRSLLYLKMPNVIRSKISPGFYCVVGSNLNAIDCNLNDTVCINYGPIYIGKNTKFSGGNLLLTSTHDFEDFSIVRAKPIIIGENVWITSRCIILGGVSIGNNSVIGAGSVVTSDIPSGVLAAGNPCKIIRKIEI